MKRFSEYLTESGYEKPVAGLHPMKIVHIEDKIHKRHDRQGVPHDQRWKIGHKGYTYLTKKQSLAARNGERINKGGYHYELDHKEMAKHK